MKSYSVDLRQKIIDIRETEKISIRKIAERFNVAKSFVQKLLKQYQETGDIRPKKRGGNQKKKLDDENLVSLIEIMEKNNDATLEELGEMLREQTNIKVCTTTIWKITTKLDYSWKKKRCMHQKRTVKESKKREESFGEKSKIFSLKT